MQFHAFGGGSGKTLLVMHGMRCDWRKFREIFMPPEQDSGSTEKSEEDEG